MKHKDKMHDHPQLTLFLIKLARSSQVGFDFDTESFKEKTRHTEFLKIILFLI